MNSAKIFLLSIFCSLNLVLCSKSNSSIQITLVSFDQFDSEKLEFVEYVLHEKFKFDSLEMVNQNLPTEAFYEPRNRYRADKLIRYLKENMIRTK